ncbi:MAG: polysaccharide biosynthesis/export family protein [bacterium]
MGKWKTSKRNRLSYCCFSFICTFVFLQLQDVNAQRRIPGDFAPGDAVRIVSWQSPIAKGNVENLGITDDYIIDRRGSIFLPLVGYVRVVGLSRGALADTLEMRYRKYASGLSFVCKPLIRIAVLGQVNQPGSYIVEPSASLWQVINEAGGPQTGADFQKMYYMRNGEVVAENLLTHFEKAYSIEEVGIRSGDQLYIPGKSSFSIQKFFQYVSYVTSLAILYFTIDNRSNK